MPAFPSRIERRYSASDHAGLVRIAFACVWVFFAIRVCPGETAMLVACLVYLAISMAFQLMIRQRWGAGQLRSFAMGLVDIVFLSYPVYLLGPATSVLPSGYLLIPAVNAAASPSRSRVAMLLAGAGSLAYVGLLAATGSGLLRYAPVHPTFTRHSVFEHGFGATPSLVHLIASGLLVVMSVLLTTNIVLRQMNALDRMNRKLEELSQLDELTGLFNRRHLFAELRRQLERVARGASCGVLMIDLDGFKRVNDQRGHDAGDLLLCDIAQALAAETRAVDLVARYGGDEFVVLLPDLAPEDALPVADRLVAAVAKAGHDRFPNIPVTASVGVAISAPDDDVATLLRRADTHAYAAKRAGGNRIAVHADEPRISSAHPAPSRALTH